MQARKRSGFTLIDVALAVVVLTIGILGVSKFFSTVYDQLSPTANGGGLRRYIMAESMLKAEAEALRARKFTWPDMTTHPEFVKMVTEPAGANFSLNITMPAAQLSTVEQYLFYDMSVTDSQTGNAAIAQLSVSTLRYLSGGSNVKIGL